MEREQFVVAERQGSICGYVQFHAVTGGTEFYVEGVAVDPSARGQGTAAALLNDLRGRLTRPRARSPVLLMTVSPANVAMIRAALKAGFYGARFVPDYFGPGADRLAFQTPLPPHARLGSSLFIPVETRAELARRLETGYVLLGVEKLPQGDAWLLRQTDEDDLGTVVATEIDVSVTVSASLLAAFTFLFGLSVTAADFPADILGFLAFGLLSSFRVGGLRENEWRFSPSTWWGARSSDSGWQHSQRVRRVLCAFTRRPGGHCSPHWIR